MEGLGINPVQLGAQLINVGVLIFVLHRFVYKPLNKLLEERKNEIAKGLALSQEMTEKEVKLFGEVEAEKKTVQKEKQKVLTDASREAKKQAEKIIEDARKRANDIVKKAEKDAKAYQEKLDKKAQDEITKRATELANRALAQFLDQKTRIKLTQAQLAKVNKKK